MEMLLVAGIIVCGWVFLCVLSGEREQRAREHEAKIAAQLAAENSSPAGGHREKLTTSGSGTKV